MTLPLELGQVSDPVARRALEQVSLRWPTGSPGALTFAAGAGAPSAGVGVDGAIYLDVSSGAVYGPKAAGGWPSAPIGILVRVATTYAQLSSGS